MGKWCYGVMQCVSLRAGFAIAWIGGGLFFLRFYPFFFTFFFFFCFDVHTCITALCLFNVCFLLKFSFLFFFCFFFIVCTLCRDGGY